MPPKEHLIKCLDAAFVTSFSKWNGKNIEPLPQICVVGRSNVGKSSVINALVERHGLAKTSSTPGRTQLINLFSAKFRRGVDERPFHLVDLPGYGYAKVPLALKASWLPMMQSYFDLNARIFAVVFLVDLRRTPGPEDLEFCQMAAEKNLPMLPVATKIDKIPKTQRVRELKKISDALGLEDYRDVHAVSVTERIGVDTLRADLGSMLLPPLPE